MSLKHLLIHQRELFAQRVLNFLEYIAWLYTYLKLCTLCGWILYFSLLGLIKLDVRMVILTSSFIKPSATLIDCKWIYRKKYGYMNTNEKIFKSKLIAKGFTQRKGVDHNEVFGNDSKNLYFMFPMCSYVSIWCSVWLDVCCHSIYLWTTRWGDIHAATARF